MSGIQPVGVLLQLAIRNARETFTLFWSMLSPLLFLGLAIGGIALVILPVQRSSRCRVLAATAVLIFLTFPYVMFFNYWYPRYHLPLLVPFCLIGGEVSGVAMSAWASGTSRELIVTRLSRALLFLVLIVTTINSIYLLWAPQTFPYFKMIRRQFVTGWTSGYGLQDAIETIYRLSSNYPDGIRLLRSPAWDVPLLSLDVYSRELGPGTQRITLCSREPDRIDSQLVGMLLDGKKPTYLLFNSAYPYSGDQEMVEKILMRFGAREVAHFVKPDTSPGLKLWHLERRADEGA